MSSTQYVYSKQQFISDVSFNSALTVAGVTTVSGTTTLSGTNTVSGKTQFNADASFNNALTIAGATTLSGTTTVSGAATFTSANTIINGNVGVGTASPASKLHIYDSSNPKMFLGNGTIRSYCSLYSGNLDIGNDVGSAPIRFLPDNTERMRITTAGNVGIGTASPGQKLDVNGNISTNGYMYMNSGSSYFPLDVQSSDSRHTLRLCCTPGVANSSGIAMASSFNWSGDIQPRRCADIVSGFTGTWGSEYLSFCVGGEIAEGYGSDRTERMRITAGGNVGIGTASPYIHYPLDIKPTMNVNDWKWLVMGKSATSNNQAEFGFNYVGDTSTQNKLSIGFCGNTIMYMSAAGNVGIGTATPGYPLTIFGNLPKSINTTYYYYGTFYFDADGLNTYRSYNSIGTINGNGSATMRIGTFSNYSIYTDSAFVTSSDKRIKTNIVDIDDEKALQTLRLIKPKTYDYIDKLDRGSANVIGFIAQEIKEIIPKSVTIVKQYIPNFMTVCQVSATDASNIVLVTSPIDLSWNPLHDQSGNAFVDADGNPCSDASGNKVFKVKLYDQSNNLINCKTTSILDKRSFLMDVTGTALIDTSSNLTLETDGGYFLHGQEVDDFHSLDKQAIFTVVTAAVQDIDRQVQAQSVKQQADEVKIAELESKNSALEALVAEQSQQIAQQQAQINAILAKIGGV